MSVYYKHATVGQSANCPSAQGRSQFEPIVCAPASTSGDVLVLSLGYTAFVLWLLDLPGLVRLSPTLSGCGPSCENRADSVG